MADGPSHVPLHSLESMTDNFSEDRVLGSGAYGKVYLGKREDGQKIAVKILHDMPGHGDGQFEKEFYNFANLKHQNIVRLVGFCHETRREFWAHNETRVLADVTKRALCFEFMENGSLSDCIFGKSMMMLHLYTTSRRVQLSTVDLPKITDFGLSRFFKEEKSHITNSPRGTLGYLPPEFIHHRIISNKLDIFSLGVVVIKIIAGPTGHCRSAEMTSEQFTEIVHGNWRNRLQSAASGDLLESYSEQVKRCMEIALSCLEADRQKRPTIGDIVNMLTDTETLENYHGALIDQMSTCMVNDTNLIDVHPLQLHFSFRPNKFISCPFHVTNNMDDQHVFVRWVPKHEEATRYNYACPTDIVGVVSPRSTHTFVVTMKQVQQPAANMDVLDIVVQTVLDNSRGIREVTLKAVCATTCQKTTFEVILPDDNYSPLRSMDVHPTEPWILTAYSKRLVIWNYKTQTRMMVGDSDGYIHVHDCMTMKRVKEFKAHDDWTN